MDNTALEIMIVAGEASGDRLGADLVREIKSRNARVSFFGTSGPSMRSAGVESIMNSDSWSIVGIGAVAVAVPRFLNRLSVLRRAANERKPKAVILIDFPEFNLKFAKRLKKDGHKVIYYVSPQVWAWRRYRIKTIRESVDMLLSILPFEKNWYAEQGIHHVEFVGNPIIEGTKPTRSKEEVFEKYGFDPQKKLVGLLPGSRRKEIKRHLALMIEAARLIERDLPVQFTIAAASSPTRPEIDNVLAAYPNFKACVVEGETLDLLSACDAAVISSGTATLEAAVLGTPMVVVYKLPRMDFTLFRPFVDVPHIALINLIAGRTLVEELVQHAFTERSLADALKGVLEPEKNRLLRSQLREVVDSLKTKVPTADAADLVLGFLEGRSANDLHP